MNSLLWQCLTIIAIAVVVFEARRWAARGLSRVGASFGRARARRGKSVREESEAGYAPNPAGAGGSSSSAASRPAPATVSRPPQAANLAAAVPLARTSALPGGRPTESECGSPPGLDVSRRRMRAGWLALAVGAAAAAIIVVMIIRSRARTGARAREAP